MSKLHDSIFSPRCEFCNEKLINQKVYTVRDVSTTGLGNLITYSEPILYDAVSCPRCGKQMVLGRHYRNYRRSDEVEMREVRNDL